MIKVSNLTKKYGSKLALNNVSFEVSKGEILGFLGPNGAGKTTTMNIITGYISSTSGSAEVDGYDILKNPEEVKRKIGYLPETPPLYMDMTVYDYLDFVYELKKVKLDKKKHILDILELIKINDVKDRLIKNLSKGYKQRVGLAQAMIGNPDVLILDEPTVGLDPKQINEIRSVIKRLGKNRTAILSSHILSEVSAVCERVIIINNGEIVASDTPENLSRSMQNNSEFTVRISGVKEEVMRVLRTVENIGTISTKMCDEQGATDYTIKSVDNSDLRESVFYKLAEHKMPIIMMKKQNISLEDVFLKLTTAEKTKETEVDVNESDIHA